MRGLINRIRDAFGGGPKLRNKPGGLAWINSNVDEGGGTGALVNRVVRTVRLMHGDVWLIDPPQSYIATTHLTFTQSNNCARPGDKVIADGIRDGSLTPMQGDVTHEEVEELHLAPRAPAREKERA
jgi:hypothetical protein